MAQGASISNEALIQSHKRFLAALIMYDLIHEVDSTKIMLKFSVERGFIQILQKNASMMSGCIPLFCSKMGWFNLELIFRGYQFRIDFGIKLELVDLMAIPDMKPKIARCLYESKIRTPEAIVLY